MSLIPREDAPTAADAERALAILRGDVIRADLRSFILLSDVLLDDAVKVLRVLGVSKKATKGFRAMVDHLEGDDAEWSRPLRPLAARLAGVQHSIGYFRYLDHVAAADLVAMTRARPAWDGAVDEETS
jgi:hypothetical protein